MSRYSIWMLEYAHCPIQPVGVVLAGQFNAGTQMLTFSYLVIKGEGHLVGPALALVADGCVAWKELIGCFEPSGRIHGCLPVSPGRVVFDHEKIAAADLGDGIMRNKGPEKILGRGGNIRHHKV